jgi:peptide/nickel transport system substrate-binding protein
VRRALDYSIDRERILAVALSGFGRPATGPVPPESPLAAVESPRHDVRRADSLLDAAGWKRGPGGTRQRNGRSLSFELLTVGSGDNAIEQLIQSDLSARGISMSIRQMELGAFLTLARAPAKTGWQALLTGVPGDLALSYVAAMFDGAQRGGSLDYAGYHTAALDAAFAATRSASGDVLRRGAWLAVQRQLADSVPVVWIYHARGLQGVSARLGGVQMDLRGELATVTQWWSLGPPGFRRK